MMPDRPRVTPAAALAGLRVVVTRSSAQAAGLAEAFARAGARVDLLPLLEVVPPADRRPLERAASEVALHDWLVFTSSNAVEAFLPLAGGALGARPRVASIGEATARALRAAGVEPALVAADSRAEGLAAALAPHVARRRVLLPQAADARAELQAGLQAAGAEVTAVAAYAKRVPREAPALAARLFGASTPLGWVTFTSPSIVRHFAGLFGGGWEARRPELLAASIGPVTTAALRAAGVDPAAAAAAPSDQGLVDAVAAAVWKTPLAR
jgi:uroporphyrinogen III methyltransferase/synthase